MSNGRKVTWIAFILGLVILKLLWVNIPQVCTLNKNPGVSFHEWGPWEDVGLNGFGNMIQTHRCIHCNYSEREIH